MEPETYQKFGRGGAGNYYSKKDIQQVEKKAAEVSLMTREPLAVLT